MFVVFEKIKLSLTKVVMNIYISCLWVNNFSYLEIGFAGGEASFSYTFSLLLSIAFR